MRREQADDEVLLLDVVVVVAAGERLPPRRPDQEGAEDVEHPAELLDDRGADEDEQRRAG